MLSAVSTRYARALVDVVTEPGSNIDPLVAMEQLRQVAAMVAASDDLRNALLSPAVSPSRKRAVIAKLVNVHVKIRNFLYVVIDHRRVHEIPSIVEAFEVLLDEHRCLCAPMFQARTL
jgi:F-type H+-transporting ATPase subunit delta